MNGNAETASASDTEILGVVAARGAGNSNVPPATTWTVLCEVQPWRVVGQALQEAPITLVQQGTLDEMRDLQNALHPYTIVRARVRIRPDQPTHADVVELLDFDATDVELQAHAEALQVPITHEDAVFGTLTFDRSIDWWSVDVRWNGTPTRLSITAEDDELDAALDAAHALWNEEAVWDKRLKEYAAIELLDLKNDGWLDDDDDEPINAQQFVDALTIESIGVDSDGGFTFYYDDGDLFFGHVIIVSGTLADGPDDAQIAG